MIESYQGRGWWAELSKASTQRQLSSESPRYPMEKILPSKIFKNESNWAKDRSLKIMTKKQKRYISTLQHFNQFQLKQIPEMTGSDLSTPAPGWKKLILKWISELFNLNSLSHYNGTSFKEAIGRYILPKTYSNVWILFT